MKLRTALLGILLALSMPAPAQAAPLVGILFGAAFAATTAGMIVGVIFSVIFSVLGSLLVNALVGKPPSQQRQASVVQLAIGESPRALIQGTAAVGGTLADAFNWGGTYGTDYEALIIVLADHKCRSLAEFYVNDNKITFPPGGFPGGTVPDSGGVVYNGQLQVFWLDGSAVQTLPSLVTNGGWATTGSFDGLSIAVVAYKADDPQTQSPVWSGGRPNFLWVVNGKFQYDPRLDDTVAGGSGSHRWGDPNTWEWTDNAAVCRYNWVRGVYALDQVDDPRSLLIGRGLVEMEAPPVNVFASANICDEDVALLAGGTEKRYQVNGVIRSDERYVDTEQMFADAMGGIIIQPGGSVEVEPGHARSPTFALTDDDLVVGSRVAFAPFRSAADNAWANTIVPRYVEPTQKWQDHAAPVRRVSADVTADGGAREVSLTLAQVTSGTQAQRLGEIKRRLARLVRTATLTLGPRFGGIEEGDWGTWTSERHLGGATVTWRVEAYHIDEKRQVTLSLREINSAVYDWTTADEGTSDVLSTGTAAPAAAWTSAYGAPGLLNIDLIAQSHPASDLVITASSAPSITVNTHHQVYPDRTVSVTGATISGSWAVGSRVYVYYDDSARAGGTVSYVATLVAADAAPSSANPFRHNLGWVVIPASGTAIGGVPTVPTGLTATGGNAQVALAWTANPAADNVTAYELWRAPGTGASFGSAAKIQTISALGYTDTGLTASTGFTYFLKAINAAGASAASAGVNGTTVAVGFDQYGFAFEKPDPLVSKIVFAFESPVAWNTAVNFAGSGVSICDSDTSTAVAPSAQTDFDVQSPAGTSIGTIRFAASSLTATFIAASTHAIPALQTTQCIAPSNLNGLKGMIYGSIKGTR